MATRDLYAKAIGVKLELEIGMLVIENLDERFNSARLNKSSKLLNGSPSTRVTTILV
jgi:hypothetical protein